MSLKDPQVRGRGSVAFGARRASARSRSRSRSRDAALRFDSHGGRRLDPPDARFRRDDRFRDFDEEHADRSSGRQPLRTDDSHRQFHDARSYDDCRRDAEQHRSTARRPDSGFRGDDFKSARDVQHWRHDMFDGPDRDGVSGSGSTGNQRRGPAVDDEDREPFDPYAVVRRSKAYEPDPPVIKPAAASSASVAMPGATGTAALSFLGDESRIRARSRSPRPSHDDYQWKSLAGGVAIFVKKVPSGSG